jgi:hypothetical protein
MGDQGQKGALMEVDAAIPGAGDDEALLEAALAEVPRGAAAVSGVAVLLLMIGWFLVYLLIFLPRGSVG